MKYSVTNGRNRSIKFTCPNCASPLESPLGEAGQRFDCPACGNVLTVPGTRELEESQDDRDSHHSAQRKGRWIRLVILGGLMLISLGAWRFVLYLRNLPEASPSITDNIGAVNPAITGNAGTNYKKLKLDDLIGVECVYTDSDSGNKFYNLGANTTTNLRPGQRVVFQKVIQEGTDFEHPDSHGYKVYLNASDLKNTLVMYPYGTKTTEGIDWRLPFCPVAKLAVAKAMWEGKSFRFEGTKLGNVEVVQGTVIKVVGVTAYDIHFFELTCELPSTIRTTALESLEFQSSKFKPIQ